MVVGCTPVTSLLNEDKIKKGYNQRFMNAL